MNLSRALYMTPADRDLTIDRPKPLHKKSEILVWDNKCSAQDAEWECLPSAWAQCEHLRGTDDYLQCVDDHFHACRRGAGCDYRYNTTPNTCAGSGVPQDVRFAEAVRIVCDDPSKEYPSQESYNACVDRMREWSEAGCAAVHPDEVSGAVVGSTGWRR